MYDQFETTWKSNEELTGVRFALCIREQEIYFIFDFIADCWLYVVGFELGWYNLRNISAVIVRSINYIQFLIFYYQQPQLQKSYGLSLLLSIIGLSAFFIMAFKKQAILALCSSTLTLIVLGSIYTFGTLTPYISSYLYWQGDETSNTALSVLFTLTIITINVGVAISTLFLSKISNRKLCIGSIIAVSSCVFIASFMKTFVGFVIFYGFSYGFSIGIGYFPPLKNCYLHLPHRKGLCAGICMSGFGLGSALFNYLIIGLVNPHDANVDPITHKFPQEVANNLPFALKILAAVYAFLGLLGAVFVIPPKEQKDKNYTLLSEQTAQPEQAIASPAPLSATPRQQSFSQMIKVFKQKRGYFLMLQYACVAPFGMFMAFNYKRLAFDRNDYFLQNDQLVTTIGSVGIFCNGIFRTAWGHLFDHLSYKQIIITINTCLLVFSGLVLFAVQNVVAYFAIIPCIYLSYGGLYALLPTQAVRVLGPVVGSKLFWLVFSGFSMAAVIQFTLQYFILTALGKDGYIYCIGTFFLLQVIGLVISITINYDYEQSHGKAKKKVQEESSKQSILQGNQQQ